MNSNVEHLLRLIHDDFENERNEVLEQARDEATRDYEDGLAQYKAAIEKRKQKLEQHNKMRMQILVERKTQRMRNELMKYKDGLMEEVFQKAAEKINGMPAERYMRFVKAALEASNVTGEFSMTSGENSLGMITQHDVDDMVKNMPLEITLEKRAIPGKGGFILENRNLILNFLFEDMVEDYKRQHGAIIIQRVFPD